MKRKLKILVVEDDQHIIDTIDAALGKQYKVIGVTKSKEAMEKIKKRKPDLIILDLIMQNLDGLQICKLIRDYEETSSLPIIMLTAMRETEHIIRGLEVGADDYITKPFDVYELAARIEAIIRRIPKNNSIPQNYLDDDNIAVDIRSRTVVVNGKKEKLTKTQVDLLSLLMENKNKVLSRQYLYEKLWSKNRSPQDTIALEMHLSRLRVKLKPHDGRIKTVSGEGYVFK